jgi:DNA invertase Pin-like site-specific DNA recombinase
MVTAAPSAPPRPSAPSTSKSRSGSAASPALPVVALGYRRLSTEEQRDQGVSFDAQAREIRAYAAGRDWDVGPLFEDVLSGKRDDRPGYLALLAEARRLRAQGRRVAVVVIRLDRLGRRVLERVRCREELRALGVATHSTREGGEVSDLTANILASVAEEEVRLLSEKVAAAVAYVRERGWLYPGKPPFGYRFRPATAAERAEGAPHSVAAPDPDRAPLVAEAYRRAAAGESAHAVGRWLATETGFTPRATGASRRPEAARAGAAAHALACTVLTNPVYVARPPAVARGAARVARVDADPEAILALPRRRWPALVDDATWLTVQRRIASRRPRRADRPSAVTLAGLPDVLTPADRTYPLAGYVRCPVCGGPMHGEGATGSYPTKHGRTAYVRTCYRCGSRTALVDPATGARRACTVTAHSRRLEAAVADILAPLVAAGARLAQTPALRRTVHREWARLRNADAAARRAAAKPDGAQARADAAAARRLEQQLARLEQQRIGLNRRMAAGDIDYELDYRPALEAVTADRERATAALEAVVARLGSAGGASPPSHPPTTPAAGGPTDAALDSVLDRWAAASPELTAAALAADPVLLREAVVGLVAPPTAGAAGGAGGITPQRVGGASRSVRYRADVALSDAGQHLAELAALLLEPGSPG